MIKNSFEFSWKLLVVLVLALVIQEFVYNKLHIGLQKNHLIICFAFNYALTCLFFVIMLVFKKKRSSQLGFVFLYTSVFKFVLFYVFILPMLNVNAASKGIVFLAFFVPYALSLVFEVISISRVLQKTE